MKWLSPCITLMVMVQARADIMSTMGNNGVLNKEYKDSNKSFTAMMKENPYALSMAEGELTIFAPSDEAMRKYQGQKDQEFLLNHLVNVVVQVGESGDDGRPIRLNSLSPGSPPLYLTRQGVDYYVNGAKIIMRNLQPSKIGGPNQRIHIIDRVLEPLSMLSSPGDSSKLVSLTAAKLLKLSKDFDLGGKKIDKFANRIFTNLRSSSVFETPGENTFFIPIDEAFESISINLVTEDIVKGHIVPGKLMFTRPALPTEQKTLTFRTKDGIHISTLIQGSGNSAQVKSITAKGNLENPRGEHVVANIVRANIPVANGIVHLIDRPLVIIASSLWDYLVNERDSQQISRFVEYLQTKGGVALEDMIKNCGEGTLFVPRNDAFNSKVVNMMRSSDKAKEILGLHFVNKRIANDDIRVLQPQNGMGMFSAKVSFPMNTTNQVWIHVEDNVTMYVNGLGASVEVIEPNIGATNGVIHIIDKVLGVPTQNTYSALKKDPMLSDSFSLGNQDHLNDLLQDENEVFTYLVPSNSAWDEVKRLFASAHKQLFMGFFGYQSKAIMEKHLKIGQKLSIDDLLRITNDEGGVQMFRGNPLKFEHIDGDIYVQWENIQAKVIRPNLNCTNGFIHVIDKVLMKRRDVTVSSSSTLVPTMSSVFVASILTFRTFL